MLLRVRYLNPGAVAVLTRFIERDVSLTPGQLLFSDKGGEEDKLDGSLYIISHGSIVLSVELPDADGRHHAHPTGGYTGHAADDGSVFEQVSLFNPCLIPI